MTQRIASDEPEEVGLVPRPIMFWYRGHAFQAAVSKSAGFKALLGSMPEGSNSLIPLEGEYGRAWIADPCSMALQEGLHGARMAEDKHAAADRQARRQAKAALLEEEAAARRTKTSRW